MDETAEEMSRRKAHELLDRVPEEKLIYLVQIMRGMKGLAESEKRDREAKMSAEAPMDGAR